MSTSKLVTPNSADKMNFPSRTQIVQEKPSKPVHVAHYRQGYFNFPYITGSGWELLIYIYMSANIADV